MQSRDNFIACGGKSFNYIPALNDDEENIKAMEKIILDEISSWDNVHLNLEENLMATKKLFDKHKHNRKI